MAMIKAGVVLCLASILFGSICMVVGALLGDAEDAPKVFQQMAGASCGLFALGLILSLVGWLVSLNKPEPPKLTAAAARDLAEDSSDEAETAASADQQDSDEPDDDPSDRRRR